MKEKRENFVNPEAVLPQIAWISGHVICGEHLCKGVLWRGISCFLSNPLKRVVETS